jgi:ribosomal protein L37AE/L43A
LRCEFCGKKAIQKPDDKEVWYCPKCEIGFDGQMYGAKDDWVDEING